MTPRSTLVKTMKFLSQKASDIFLLFIDLNKVKCSQGKVMN